MLNDREKEILEVINNYILVNEFSPTVREIGEMVGLKSSSTVHNYLKGLEEKGYLERHKSCPRALKLLRS